MSTIQSDEIEYSWGFGGQVYKTEQGHYIIKIPAMPTVAVDQYEIALEAPAERDGWFTFRLSPKRVESEGQ